MEDVDGIIIQQLRSISCDIDNDTQSVSEFDNSVLYGCVVRCLTRIVPEEMEDISETLPKGMSHRTRACAEIAQRIKDMGYRGDLGYHQLLYPNANDTRQLLNWLTSKLPRITEEEGSSTAAEGQDTSEILRQAIAQRLAALQKMTWTPRFGIVAPYRRKYNNVHKLHTSSIEGPFVTSAASRAEAAEQEADIRAKQPYVTEQPPRRQDVVPSLIEHNCAKWAEETDRKEEWEKEGLESGLNPWQFRKRKRDTIVSKMSEHLRYSLEESEAMYAKAYAKQQQQASTKAKNSTWLARQTDFKQDVTAPTVVKETAEDILKRREEQIAERENRIDQLKGKMELIRKEIESLQNATRQTEAAIVQADRKHVALDDRYRIDSTVFERLLPDAENNIQKLQEMSEAAARRLLELAAEWEQHRAPLINALRDLKESHQNREGGSADLISQIKGMRTAMKELGEEVQSKDERYQQLLEVYRQLPKNINRSVYTSRILDIVKQVKKQKVDINKILLDTRALQKEINSNIEALGRSFALTNEVIYVEAKKEEGKKKSSQDPTARTAYKDLVEIHDKFKELSDKVTECGNVSNTVLDMEQKVQQLNVRAGSLDLDRINEDLDAIRGENRALLSKLA